MCDHCVCCIIIVLFDVEVTEVMPHVCPFYVT